MHGATIKIDIGVFIENMSRKFKFHSKVTRVTGNLKGLRTFLLISRLIPLRKRKDSEKIVQNNKTHSFLLNNRLFPRKSCLCEIVLKNPGH